MDYEITLNEAVASRRRVTFRLPSDSDGYTPVTGASPSGYIYKNGAIGVALAGTFTEVDSTNAAGVYYYEATAGEVDTEGFAVFAFIASGAVTQVHTVRIGATNGALADGQAVIESDIAALNDFDPATDTVAHVTLVDTTSSNSDMRGTDNAVLSTDARLDNLDATISSRSSHTVADIWSYTTRTLTSFGTLASDVASAVWGYATRTLTAFGFTVDTTDSADITAIKNKTDNLPADPASQSLVDAKVDGAEADIRGGTESLETLKTAIDDVPQDVDTQLSATHGSGGWEPYVSPGSGANTVTIHLEDIDTGNPIPYARVYVKTLAGFVAAAFDTDDNGDVTFLLDSATYNVYVSKVGAYSFDIPYELVVAGDMTETIQGTAFSPSQPPSPDTCVVYGWEYLGDGSPKSGIVVKAEIVGDRNFLQNEGHTLRTLLTTTTDLSGYWELPLTRTELYIKDRVSYRILINNILVATVQIPDQNNVALTELVS